MDIYHSELTPEHKKIHIFRLQFDVDVLHFELILDL